MKRLLPMLLLLPAALGAQDPAPSSTLRDSYRRLVSKFREELRSPDARPWDVWARAEAIGSDPAALLEFVRKIRLEPYPGFQRGPSGVLVSGGGNSADKAFLLAELLRARGHAARVVRATLTAEQAAELARAALVEARKGPVEPASGPFASWKADPARLRSVAADAGISPDDLARFQKAAGPDLQDRWNEVLDVTEREVRFLAGRFAPLDAEKPRDLAPEIVEWLRTHYWVQAQKGDAWSDLDPSFAGDRPRVEGEIVDPAALADTFRLRLTLDRKAGDLRETVELFDWNVGVHETLLRPIRFVILPDRGLDDLLKPGKATDAQVRERLRSFRRFQASIMVGSETLGSDGFDLDGGVFKISKNGSFVGGAVAGKVGAALDFFAEKPKAKTELLNLKVRFELLREGRPLWTRDRTILEEGAKEAWCPILAWDLLLQTHPFSAAFASGMGMTQAVKNHGFSERALAALESPKRGKAAEDIGSPAFLYPFELLMFARSRAEFVRGRAKDRPLGLVWEHADLLVTGGQPRLSPEGVCLCEAFDLVENGALVVEAGDRFALRRDETLALGAFDTVLEQVILRQANPAEPTNGAVAAFERARIVGGELALVAAGEAGPLRDAGLRDKDAEWVVAHARPGERMLAVRGRGDAWWSYEPSTGRTVGRITGGRGGSEALRRDKEYVINLANARKWLTFIGCFAAIIKRTMNGTLDIGDAFIMPLCLVSAGIGLPGASVTAGAEAGGHVIALLLQLISFVR